MAGAAILLELLMPLDQLSWHHHTFPIDRIRRRSDTQENHRGHGSEEPEPGEGPISCRRRSLDQYQ